MKDLSIDELQTEPLVKMFADMPPELYKLCSSENHTLQFAADLARNIMKL